MLHSRPSACVGDILPGTSSIDRLAGVVEDYGQSAHRRQSNIPVCSTELPDPIIDLDIFALPD